MKSTTWQPTFDVELSMNEACAIRAGLRLLQHFNVNGKARTCIVTDAGGAPSFVRMDEIDELARFESRGLTHNQIEVLINKVLPG